MGDNLDNLVKEAQKWFKDNNVKIPKYAKDWQTSSVNRGEIPPGTGRDRLKKLGITQKQFITLLNNKTYIPTHINNPITEDNIKEKLGLEWVSSTVICEHKKVKAKCLSCGYIDIIDYGTLKRMEKVGNKFCYICRKTGGKIKPISVYNKFNDFIPIAIKNGYVIYSCTKCNNCIERTIEHVNTTEYLVCEHCSPYNVGCTLSTEYGKFDSKFEYLCYKKLLTLLNKEDIKRQISYDTLLNTGTRHTADFYIPKLDLILEVTTKSNNIGRKYNDTMSWKLSLSDKVHFAYSLTEVEDIVHSALKNAG